MNKQFDEKIRKASTSYKPEPNLQWTDIESKLDNNKQTYRISMRRFVSIAASIAILVVAIYMLFPQEETGTGNSLYVQSSSIEDLNSSLGQKNSNIQYSVADVYYAYHQAGLMHTRH